MGAIEVQKTDIEKLIRLYSRTSKHSNYQVLPPVLNNYIPSNSLHIHSRQEEERWLYILQKVEFVGKAVADVGGNTGYFSFRMIEQKASTVDYFEGNSDHAGFVEHAARVLDIEDKIVVHNEYVNLKDYLIKDKVDIMLLLNVLHHVGDDYGDDCLTRNAALNDIILSLKNLSRQVNHLVFQLGYNWKGDRNMPLFENGTKREVVDFIEKNTEEDWEIENIGIATRVGNEVHYNDLDEVNVARDDSLGEFLNRPIFFMRSKRFD